MSCETANYVGRDIGLEYAIGCGDILPLETDWNSIGAMRTKEFNLEYDTVDGTNDDSIGNMRDSLATYLALTMGGGGTLSRKGPAMASLKDLTRHFIDPIATGGQPVVWLRMTFPDLTFTCFMLLTTLSRDGEFESIAEYTLEASSKSSAFGLIVEDTPSDDAPDPASVDLIPATLTLTVGMEYNFEAIVLPAGASQRLRWESSDTAVATVNPVTGVVTALAGGTATITAKSAENDAITDTAALTVVPAVLGINVSPATVSVAESATEQITATVYPSGAVGTLTYESAGTGIATVNSSGLVTGVAAGTTSIRITSAARPTIFVDVPVTVTPA